MVNNEESNLPDALEAAYARYEEGTAAVEEIGRENLETLASALGDLDRLVREYEDRATGTGDFGGYVAFRQQVETLVEELPDDVPHRDAFEAVGEIADKRRLSESDFESIRESVNEVRSVVERLESERQGRLAYRDTRREARKRVDEIDTRIERLDSLLSLAEVDLDAPVGEIREPISGYNDAVRAAFAAYLERTPAREVLELFELTSNYPLVPMDPPPERLLTYLDDLEEALTVPELLEYADYSRSKLAHYVEEPAALKTAVATDRTYLERLGAEPFLVEWPPPPAEELQWRLRELIPLVDRFDADDAIEAARAIRAMTRDRERFAHLREVAIAKSTLDENQRERILSGALQEERATLADRRIRLQDMLADLPEP